MPRTRTHQTKDLGLTLVELLIVIVILGILTVVTVFAVKGIADKSKGTAAEQHTDPVTESIWHLLLPAELPTIENVSGDPVTEGDLVQISCEVAGGKSFYKDTGVFHTPDTTPELAKFKDALSKANIRVYFWESGEGGTVDTFIMNTTGLGFTLTTDEARTAISKVVSNSKICVMQK